MTIQVSRESDLGQTYKSTLLLLETSCFDSWIFITCQYNTQYWYGISRCRSSLLLCLYKCTRCQPFSSSGMLSVFLWPQLALQNSKGTLNGGIKYTGVGNICVSDSFRHFVLESIKISALIGSHRYLIDHCHFWWPWVTLKGVTRGAWFSGRSQHVNLYCLTNNDQIRHGNPSFYGVLHPKGRVLSAPNLGVHFLCSDCLAYNNQTQHVSHLGKMHVFKIDIPARGEAVVPQNFWDHYNTATAYEPNLHRNQSRWKLLHIATLGLKFLWRECWIAICLQ